MTDTPTREALPVDNHDELLDRTCVRHFGKADTLSGELVVNVMAETDRAMILFRAAAGPDIGAGRMVSMSIGHDCGSCSGTKFHVDSVVEMPAPAPAPAPATTAPNWGRQANRPPSPKVIVQTVANPDEELKSLRLMHVSSAWLVCPIGTRDAIARCDTLAAAQLVAAKLGPEYGILKARKRGIDVGPWPAAATTMTLNIAYGSSDTVSFS